MFFWTHFCFLFWLTFPNFPIFLCESEIWLVPVTSTGFTLRTHHPLLSRSLINSGCEHSMQCMPDDVISSVTGTASTEFCCLVIVLFSTSVLLCRVLASDTQQAVHFLFFLTITSAHCGELWMQHFHHENWFVCWSVTHPSLIIWGLYVFSGKKKKLGTSYALGCLLQFSHKN